MARVKTAEFQVIQAEIDAEQADLQGNLGASYREYDYEVAAVSSPTQLFNHKSHLVSNWANLKWTILQSPSLSFLQQANTSNVKIEYQMDKAQRDGSQSGKWYQHIFLDNTQ